MKLRLRFLPVCSCAFLSLYAIRAVADDWPQMLGPHRNGISAETELVDSFPEKGLPVVWSKPLGVGMSGIAVVGGSAFTLFQDADDQYVTALDVTTGDVLWKTKVAPWYKNSMGNGPRATPTVAGGTVFAFTGEGILGALNAENGELLWSVNTTEDLTCKPAEYGMASSPLVIGDVVIVQVGSKVGAVAAYSRKDGARAWVAGRGAAGYSSPVVMELAGKEQVVAFVGAAVMGIDPADGKEIWAFDFVTDFDTNVISPLQLDGASLLISAGENHGSTVLKIKMDGDGFAAEAVWESLGESSVLRAEWQTPILHDGHLFALDNEGGAGPITNLVCVRVKDGEQIWKEPKFGKSNLTMADGKLFIVTMKGELVLIGPTADGFNEISRSQIQGFEGAKMATRQAPVIADGKLYLRDDRSVVCLDVSK